MYLKAVEGVPRILEPRKHAEGNAANVELLQDLDEVPDAEQHQHASCHAMADAHHLDATEYSYEAGRQPVVWADLGQAGERENDEREDEERVLGPLGSREPLVGGLRVGHRLLLFSRRRSIRRLAKSSLTQASIPPMVPGNDQSVEDVHPVDEGCLLRARDVVGEPGVGEVGRRAGMAFLAGAQQVLPNPQPLGGIVLAGDIVDPVAVEAHGLVAHLVRVFLLEQRHRASVEVRHIGTEHVRRESITLHLRLVGMAASAQGG